MRVFAVLLAFACAALMAPVLILAHSVVDEGLSGDFSIGVSLAVIGLLAVTAVIYALPVALPVIVATDWYGVGDWRIFAGAGVVLGTLMALLFTPVPFSWDEIELGFPFTLIAIVLACVMTYWAIAWKWLAPLSRPKPAQ